MEKVPGTQCDSEVYTGQSCMQQLVTTQSCTLRHSKEPVMVTVLGQQQQIQRMTLFNTTLDALKGELPNSRLIMLTGTAELNNAILFRYLQLSMYKCCSAVLVSVLISSL